MSKSNLGPAWFKHRRDAGQKVRVFIKGWFTPLHGFVEEVQGNSACIAGRWVVVSGKNSEVRSAEVIQ